MKANPKVSLYYNCKTQDGWKRFPAAIGGNHRIRPRFAQVNATTQTFYEAGHYELRMTVDGRKVWKNVGEDAAAAQAEQTLESKRRTAQFAANEAGTKLVETAAGRIHLGDKADDFFDRQIARGVKRNAQVFIETWREFATLTKVTFADQITESTILSWYAALRKGGNVERTLYNKHVAVFNFLRWLKLDCKTLAANAPKFTETKVEIFKPEELKAFFDAITSPYHRIVFQVLLKTGMRKQEAMFLEWRDINWEAGTIKVSEKSDLGFQIKDRAEREVPVPDDLIEQLKVWKETHGQLKTQKETKTGRLILGTSLDTPNWKWLPILKRIAYKAGLNCGHCKECRESEGKCCEHWFLHKFRATWVTSMLRELRDPRTVMEYSGHADMKTMLRYLAPIEAHETQKRVNTISWGD